MHGLLDQIRQGDRRSLARAMSLVDRPGRDAQRLKDLLRCSTGQVPWWGLTGPPGVGKSTLIDALLSRLRQRGQRVGVVAVDPTSPLSDGALLGDRVRMMQHAVDRDVFIRSLATHHREGGLSDAALHCARLLELAGYDPVLIETVGVGQNEADIASVADLCVVMLGPGYGDDIQLIKAGLLEIADVVVVNKCDLREANRLLTDVREALGVTAPAASTENQGRGREGTHRPAERDRDVVRDVTSRDAPADPAAAPIDVVGIEARSGKGVDQLLEKLLALDRAARSAECRQGHSHRRALDEIRRGTLLLCEEALERGLATARAKELVAQLERGELSLEQVVSFQLSVLSEEIARERGLKTEN
jgi:LAO/AO transport system ATPase